MPSQILAPTRTALVHRPTLARSGLDQAESSCSIAVHSHHLPIRNSTPTHKSALAHRGRTHLGTRSVARPHPMRPWQQCDQPHMLPFGPVQSVPSRESLPAQGAVGSRSADGTSKKPCIPLNGAGVGNRTGSEARHANRPGLKSPKFLWFSAAWAGTHSDKTTVPRMHPLGRSASLANPQPETART